MRANAYAWLPIQDAAREYAIGLSTLWKYVRLGRLRSGRRGFDRRTFIVRHEIEALLQPTPSEINRAVHVVSRRRSRLRSGKQAARAE